MFHDEIKPERWRRRFLGHGLLFVPEDWVPLLFERLQEARRRHGYWGEIHFRHIKGASTQNAAYQVAAAWVEEYLGYAVRGCPFKVFIVEQSGGPGPSFPYPGEPGYEEHLEHSLLSTCLAGIRWSLWREQQVRIRPIFDDTDSDADRAAARRLPARLQSECNRRRVMKSKRYPRVRVQPVDFVSSDPARVTEGEAAVHAEFVQLCDLLLGACDEALRLSVRSPSTGRRELALSIRGVLADAAKASWLRGSRLGRNFSVSLYPDANNFAYPAIQRKPTEEAEQPRLPGFGRRATKRLSQIETLLLRRHETRSKKGLSNQGEAPANGTGESSTPSATNEAGGL